MSTFATRIRPTKITHVHRSREIEISQRNQLSLIYMKANVEANMADATAI